MYSICIPLKPCNDTENCIIECVNNALGTNISQDKKSSYNLKFLKMYIKIIGPRAQVQRRQVGGSRNRWKNKTRQNKNT